MTEPDPVSEAKGTVTVNIGNPPSEDNTKWGTGKGEDEKKLGTAGQEAKEEKGTDGKVEIEDKNILNKKNDEEEMDGGGKKEVDVVVADEKEEDGAEVTVEKKECEVKENIDETEGGNAIKDDEEKDGEHQNGLTKLENIESVKDDFQTVNTGGIVNMKVEKEEYVKDNDAEDVKIKDADDVEDEEKGIGIEKAENVKDNDAEGVKMEDADDVKEEEKGTGKDNDAEDVKMEDVDGAKEEEKGTEIDEQGKQGRTENDVNKNADGEVIMEKINEYVAEGPRRKRPRSKKASQKGERVDTKEGETRSKELLRSPSSIDRPVRERKTVERLVEVIEKEPNREFQVEKGRGTPLKDIPNVVYKLSRKKPADIKLIHQTLFGRRGKAINFKSHILQFSGFVWHESDEKQKAKMKEKLDKYVKDTLLDLCDLFDLPVSRANSRKEDLVAKILDFMVAPHPITDAILAEGQKSRKRKRMARGSSSKGRGWVLTKHSSKRTKNEDTTAKESSAQETDEEEEEEEEEKDENDNKGEKDDKENDLSDEEKVDKHSENEVKQSESEESAEQDDDEDEYEQKAGKGKNNKKRAIKKRGNASKEKLKVASSPKSSPSTRTKSPTKRSYSKRAKAQEDIDAGAKVLTTKNLNSPKKKSTPKSNTKQKTADKKRAGREKAKQLDAEQPSKEELRKKICEILKEVDFNTATFTDILKQLATHYKADLTPRKATLKLMIQEELTKLAEEADEDEEDEDDDNKDEKEGKTQTKGKEVEV